MKKFRISKWLLALALGVMVATGLQSPIAAKAAYPGRWEQDENGWKYVEYSNQGREWTVNEGLRIIGGKPYGFLDGYMVTGGWKKVYGYDVYAGTDGALLTGWQDIGGKTYYFYSNGRMAMDATIDGKYYVDENGVYVGANQWKSDSRGWYYVYANPKGFEEYDSETGERTYYNYPKNTREKIDGAWYAFDENGYMRTGWISETQKTYQGTTEYFYTHYFYADTNGKLVRGWKQIDGTWYYFDEQGYMLYNYVVDGYQLGDDGALVGKVGRWMRDDRGWWYQTDVPICNELTWEEVSGYPRSGWYLIEGEIYCFDADGYMITGWVDMNKLADPSYTGAPKWHYFNEDGTPPEQYSWKQIDGVWYYFDNWYGHMAVNTTWDGYEFDENGGYKKMETETTLSWKTDGTHWWYEDTDGEYRANGIYYIDGKHYAFDGNGYMLTGWIDTSKLGYVSNWYYFESDGSGAQGWKQIDGAWYYFDGGYMCHDTVIDDCYINSDGVWVDPDPGYAIAPRYWF